MSVSEIDAYRNQGFKHEEKGQVMYDLAKAIQADRRQRAGVRRTVACLTREKSARRRSRQGTRAGSGGFED